MQANELILGRKRKQRYSRATEERTVVALGNVKEPILLKMREITRACVRACDGNQRVSGCFLFVFVVCVHQEWRICLRTLPFGVYRMRNSSRSFLEFSLYAALWRVMLLLAGAGWCV